MFMRPEKMNSRISTIYSVQLQLKSKLPNILGRRWSIKTPMPDSTTAIEQRFFFLQKSCYENMICWLTETLKTPRKMSYFFYAYANANSASFRKRGQPTVSYKVYNMTTNIWPFTILVTLCFFYIEAAPDVDQNSQRGSNLFLNFN